MSKKTRYNKGSKSKPKKHKKKHRKVAAKKSKHKAKAAARKGKKRKSRFKKGSAAAKAYMAYIRSRGKVSREEVRAARIARKLAKKRSRFARIQAARSGGAVAASASRSHINPDLLARLAAYRARKAGMAPLPIPEPVIVVDPIKAAYARRRGR